MGKRCAALWCGDLVPPPRAAMAPSALPTAETTLPRPVPPALRRLPWPRVAAVDLTVEFPWLILHERAADEWAARTQAAIEHGTPGDEDDNDGPQSPPPRTPLTTKGSSVYAQSLRAPRSPPSMGSPAQRAARKMLQLQHEMDRRDADAKLRAQAALGSSPAKPRAPVRTPLRVAPVVTTKPTKPHRVARAAREAAASPTPQARLQQWLARQQQHTSQDLMSTYSSEMAARIHGTTHATLGAGLWADAVASPIAAELSSESVFGGYVATRRLAYASHPPLPQAPESNTEETPLTATTLEVNTEYTDVPVPDHDRTATTIEAALLPTPSPPRSAGSIVTQFADDVRADAHALVADGNVRDALATLQRGIDRVLRDFQDNADELRTRGFDYSALAHTMAHRLQRAYKRRHATRLSALVRIQRAWRGARGRRAYLAQRTWLANAARVIQRPYRKHFARCRRARSAVRIQRCFRVFQSQKLLVWLHRACRWVSTEQRRTRVLAAAKKRRQRRLWVRLGVVLTMLKRLATRRRTVSLLQAQWRGRCARKAYAQVQAGAIDREARRRRREDAVVEPLVTQFRAHMRTFYWETTHGRALVGWKLRAPWLRWRRLRCRANHTAAPPHHPPVTTADLAAALRAMYAQRNGDNKDVRLLHGLEARCVGAVLGRTLVRGGLERWSDATTTSETHQCLAPTRGVVHTETNAGTQRGPRSWKQRLSTGWTQRRTQWTAQWTTWRAAAARSLHTALWTLVVYPKLQFDTSAIFRARRRRARDAAATDLLNDHDRVARAWLRRVFRDHDGEHPKFVCAWCGAGAATARCFYAHRNAPTTGCAAREQRAERERAATAADVVHHDRLRTALRTLRWLRERPRPYAPATRGDAPTAFAEDAAFVRRVAVRSGRWRSGSRDRAAALRCLVAAAQRCGRPADVASAVAVAPTALLAQLVWLLDDASGHALERIHTTTHVSAGRPAAVAWIRAEDAARALGLVPAVAPTTQRPLVWQRVHTLWQRVRHGHTYRPRAPHAHRDNRSGRSGGGNAWRRGSSWRRGIMARVVALA